MTLSWANQGARSPTKECWETQRCSRGGLIQHPQQGSCQSLPRSCPPGRAEHPVWEPVPNFCFPLFTIFPGSCEHQMLQHPRETPSPAPAWDLLPNVCFLLCHIIIFPQQAGAPADVQEATPDLPEALEHPVPQRGQCPCPARLCSLCQHRSWLSGALTGKLETREQKLP